MRRVLIGEFDVMVDIGMRDVLTRNGCEVVSDHRITASTVAAVQPAAVVVDLDDFEVTTSAEKLIALFPDVPIIECSSSTPKLRVFPANASGRPHDVPLSIDAFINAVGDREPTTPAENHKE